MTGLGGMSMSRPILSLKKPPLKEEADDMQVAQAVNNEWNAVDALLSLALARKIHEGDPIAISNCATRLLSKCDQEVRSAILQPVIWSDDPASMVDRALAKITV